MPHDTRTIPLSLRDLRAVTQYAAECAQDALALFERAHPGDARPRDALDAAWAFARGGARGKTLRSTAVAYLHPLADAHQVKHILGAAAHAARAAELVAGDDRAVGAAHIEQARQRATPAGWHSWRRWHNTARGFNRGPSPNRGPSLALR